MIRSAAELLTHAALKTAKVQVRGQEVTVREMSALAREAVVEKSKTQPLAAQTLIVLHCVCDPDGKPLFATTDADIDKVRGMPTDVLDAIAEKAMELSGMKGAEGPKA